MSNIDWIYKSSRLITVLLVDISKVLLNVTYADIVRLSTEFLNRRRILLFTV